jgi:hypothetical protein
MRGVSHWLLVQHMQFAYCKLVSVRLLHHQKMRLPAVSLPDLSPAMSCCSDADHFTASPLLLLLLLLHRPPAWQTEP